MNTATGRIHRLALYARVSTGEQSCENQALALRAYATARGWPSTDYADQGISGAKDRRPALDAMMAAARARKVDAIVCVKLDRLARSVHHLVTLGKELEALGVDMIVLDQGIDTSTPSGRLLFHMLAAIAEFERDLIRERVTAGLRRAQLRGTRSGRAIGRPRVHQVDTGALQALMTGEHLSLRGAARRLGVSPHAARRAVQEVSAQGKRGETAPM
jgi:DNA invertase Pin-like site-specific DNA recombinase